MGEKSVGEKSFGENRGRWDAGFRFPLLRFQVEDGSMAPFDRRQNTNGVAQINRTGKNCVTLHSLHACSMDTFIYVQYDMLLYHAIPAHMRALIQPSMHPCIPPLSLLISHPVPTEPNKYKSATTVSSTSSSDHSKQCLFP